MPFNYPATELWTPAGDRKVVFSLEEYEQALKDGHTEQQPAKKKSKPAKDSEEAK